MIRTIATILLAFCASIIAVDGHSADLDTKFALNLDVTKKIAAAAESYAHSNDWNVVIAIVDDGGNLLYLQRDDGVQIGSIEVAIRKAESAINFKRPTRVFQDALANGRTSLVTLPGAIVFDGGLPIVYQGHYLGAIGVSGVTAEQDGFIAKAAVDALPGIVAD